MKRTLHTALLATATSLTALSGLAHADTDATFYGVLDVWAGSKELPGSDGSTAKLDAGGFTTSFLGAKVSTDLPNGMKGVAVVESFLRPDTGEDRRYGGDEFFARNAYIGVVGDFGTLKAGRSTAPMFVPTLISNPFGGAFGFSPLIQHSFLGGNNGPIAGDSAWANALSYTSPTLGGVTANLMYAFGEQEGDSGANRVGGSLTYRAGGLMLTAAGHSIEEGAIDTNGGVGDAGALGALEQDGLMAGASYDFGVVKVFASWQQLETGTAGGDIDTDTGQAGVSVPVGKGFALASYANTDYSGSRDTERDTWTVGYDYPFNEVLDVYVAYMHDDLEDTGDGNTYGVGSRFKF
ncbi:porin [Alcanivorax marinus]|uniref:Porin n=1 Tax=Alloalcanivorax marinus TaxID=1177169 RepID=A0A9Q3UNA7_9GAMM|nr:porin [Alloalcanivorax marinus]MCC4309116.1 porin [Alloalcanivorax marinus]